MFHIINPSHLILEVGVPYEPLGLELGGIRTKNSLIDVHQWLMAAHHFPLPDLRSPASRNGKGGVCGLMRLE